MYYFECYYDKLIISKKNYYIKIYSKNFKMYSNYLFNNKNKFNLII